MSSSCGRVEKTIYVNRAVGIYITKAVGIYITKAVGIYITKAVEVVLLLRSDKVFPSYEVTN